jgi:hypothetical protein
MHLASFRKATALRCKIARVAHRAHNLCNLAFHLYLDTATAVCNKEARMSDACARALPTVFTQDYAPDPSGSDSTIIEPTRMRFRFGFLRRTSDTAAPF